MRGFRNLSYLSALAAALAVLAGCADGTGTQTLSLNAQLLSGDVLVAATEESGECAAPADEAALADRVVELVNAERAKLGIAPVEENAKLKTIAEDYACRMIAEDFFSHYAPDGDGPGERAIHGGYVFMRLGENLAAGQTSPEQVIAEWMASDQGHRENILSPQWSEIGVAVRLGGDRGIYWVQEFGDPPGR
jgi:uncharacterized protein YkwD